MDLLVCRLRDLRCLLWFFGLVFLDVSVFQDLWTFGFSGLWTFGFSILDWFFGFGLCYRFDQSINTTNIIAAVIKHKRTNAEFKSCTNYPCNRKYPRRLFVDLQLICLRTSRKAIIFILNILHPTVLIYAI